MNTYKKTNLLLLFILAFCCSCTVTEKPTVNLYVIASSGGSGIGNIDKPYHNLTQAINAARQFKNQPVNIWLREGEYFLKETLKLTHADSRFPYAPLTISAYKDEGVILTGAVKLPYWNKVVDSAVLSQLSDKARGHVQVTNLKQYGITDFGSPKSGGIELFYNDEKMQLSRYPNDKNLIIFALVEPNTKIIRSQKGSVVGKLYYKGDFAERWSKEKDIWLHGYWFWNWRDEHQQVESIDTSKKIIEVKKPYHHYGYKRGQGYYAYNLLSEIDEPGEWYLDRYGGNLYYYPTDNLSKIISPEVSVINNLIQMNKVSYISLKNLTIAFAKNNGISIYKGESNLLENLVIKHIGQTAVQIKESTNSQIISSEIYSIGGSAIILKGGNRELLTNGNICATNNEIYNYAMVKYTIRPAVYMSGVGNCAKNNEIYDAPHLAIFYQGNNHLIEYNVIHDVVKQSNDAGAIYAGKDWSSRGNIIRYNYLYDINGLDGKGAKGIYIDDELSGVKVFGNVFDNVQNAVFIGGGRDNLVVNNLFINSEPSIHIDARGVGWHKEALKILMNRLNKVPYESSVWKEQYPNIGEALTVNTRLPVRNVIKQNAFFDKKWNGIYSEAKQYIILKDNHFFVNEKPTLDYQLKSKVNGFQSIPFKRIGIQAH